MSIAVDLAPEHTAQVQLFSRPVVLACLVLAPALEVIESVVSLLLGTSTSADLTAIGANREAFVAAVLVGLLATILYIPAFLGLASACVQRSPWPARIGGTLAVVSMMGFCGVRMLQTVQLQLVDDGYPKNAAAALIDHTGTNPIGVAILVMFLGGTVIGVLSLAAAAWRSGLSKTAAALLIAFPFVDQAIPGHLGSIVSHVVMLVALTWLAVSLHRHQLRL